MEDTILRTATLNQADFDQAKLSGTRLDDADLSAVLNLTPEQVESAKYWKTAIYSPEFRQEMGLSPAAFEKVSEE